MEEKSYALCVAHINKSQNNYLIQSVSEHCRNVATICSKSLKPIGLKETGYLVGLLHDMGKCTSVFYEYITKAAEGSPVIRGSVNHTFAAVKYLFSRYSDNPEDLFSCEVLGWVVGSHHGQFDCIDPRSKSGFIYRIEKKDIHFEEACRRYFHEVAEEKELDKLFKDSKEEIMHCVEVLSSSYNDAAICTEKNNQLVLHFKLSALCRMILSALIDADRADTAAFMDSSNCEFYPEEKNPCWRQYIEVLDSRVLDLPRITAVQKARSKFSQQCANFEYEKGQIYRLWLPTGGGKTISSLRAALAMADRIDASRLIFVIPLLSVLEQNACVIRDYIGNDSIVLEHHSNVLHEGMSDDELGRNETLTETWRSPVVITTLVQLLNTLFKGKGSCVRRMNSLIDSVVVIDEVQSVPHEHLSCFNLMMNYLIGFCGASVILCSATQPCFEKLKHPMKEPIDIVEYDKDLWDPFDRTYVVQLEKPFDFDELAKLVYDCQEKYGSVLLICNTKKQAREMYRIISSSCSSVIHLSTGMCMSHRINCIEQLANQLKACESVICVSTQLIESGVDLSFGSVIRVLAGVDNIAQAAGRCNRDGENEGKRPVFVVRLKAKYENLSFLKDISQAQDATTNVLAAFDDLFCADAVDEYYRSLFADMRKSSLDSPCRLYSEKVTLLDLLSLNDVAFREASKDIQKHQSLRQAAKTAGSLFEVFNEKTIDVIVPYGEGKSLIASFLSERAKNDEAYRKNLADQAKQFTISLFTYQIEAMKGGAIVTLGNEDAKALSPAYYSMEFGFDEQGDQDLFLSL